MDQEFFLLFAAASVITALTVKWSVFDTCALGRTLLETETLSEALEEVGQKQMLRSHSFLAHT